jgi:hypothetical protein
LQCCEGIPLRNERGKARQGLEIFCTHRGKSTLR